MNFNVIVDWKFVVALGAAVGTVVVCAKMDPEAAEKVSTHVLDTCKEFLAGGNDSK